MVASEDNRRHQKSNQTPEKWSIRQKTVYKLSLRIFIELVPQRAHCISISRKRSSTEGNIHCYEECVSKGRNCHWEDVKQHDVGASILRKNERDYNWVLTPREALRGLIVKRRSLSITNLNWMNCSTGATRVMKGYKSIAIQSSIWKNRVLTTSSATLNSGFHSFFLRHAAIHLLKRGFTRITIIFTKNWTNTF